MLNAQIADNVQRNSSAYGNLSLLHHISNSSTGGFAALISWQLPSFLPALILALCISHIQHAACYSITCVVPLVLITN
jgi:hypothetical protein